MNHLILQKKRNIKIFIIFISITLMYHYYKSLFGFTSEEIKQDPLRLQYVVVHIDLKGAPPKLIYLRNIIPMLKHHGVNALLMEYEDMFPYEGKLASISAKNCYGRVELRNFINFSIQQGIEIIPLIQTLGHLEHALKLEEYRDLRENPAYPDSICPTNAKSKQLLSSMLQQVVTFHDSIAPLKHIHIGCDEAYIFNTCKRCKSENKTYGKLFEHHVKYIANITRHYNKHVTVLIWDDMLRTINPLAWEEIDYFHNIEPVYWDYRESYEFPHLHIMNYKKKFGGNWAASAFKGADGRAATVPNLRNRLLNHYSWMKRLQTKIPCKQEVYKFKGIILTAWSRYSHMDPLCELLPVAMHSLILNLRMINFFSLGGVYVQNDIDNFFHKHLRNDDQHLTCVGKFPVSQEIYKYCRFDGVNLYKCLYKYRNFINDSYNLLQKSDIYQYDYYFQSKYVNKHNIDINIYNNIWTKLQNYEKIISNNMLYYYEKDVVKEYIGYKTFNLKKNLEHIRQNLKLCKAFNKNWESRPLF